jgi:hypothetical protein
MSKAKQNLRKRYIQATDPGAARALLRRMPPTKAKKLRGKKWGPQEAAE